MVFFRFFVGCPSPRNQILRVFSIEGASAGAHSAPLFISLRFVQYCAVYHLQHMVYWRTLYMRYRNPGWHASHYGTYVSFAGVPISGNEYKIYIKPFHFLTYIFYVVLNLPIYYKKIVYAEQ
jgi:hypothetical protein